MRAAAAALALAWAGSGCAGALQPASAPAGSSEGQIDDATSLIAAMHRMYEGRWYRTLSFKQTVSRFPPSGDPPPEEVWTEYAEVPGKLRIDLGDGYSGNGVIYRGDSLYVFQDGALAQRVERRNPLMLLGFDVYGQPPARTLEILNDEGFDLTRFHRETWQGRPVYIVGAESGDTTSAQFWVDQERLLFVRLLQPFEQDPSRTSDIRFDDYEPLSGGWIAPTVVFLLDGREFMREVYFDIRADPVIAPSVFDPDAWGPVR